MKGKTEDEVKDDLGDHASKLLVAAKVFSLATDPQIHFLFEPLNPYSLGTLNCFLRTQDFCAGENMEY